MIARFPPDIWNDSITFIQNNPSNHSAGRIAYVKHILVHVKSEGAK